MAEIQTLNKKCPNCGADAWVTNDQKGAYLETCVKCAYMVEYTKTHLVAKFECPDCGALSGTPEENDYKFGIRCNNCQKLHIQFEKGPLTWNTRNKKIEENNNQPRCPHCGSTAGFTPVRRKWSLLTGFMTNKVDMVCNNCGKAK